MKKFAALVLALLMLTTCALAAEYTYNPEKPYDGVMTGLFNNVAITAGEDTGLATYYLPEGMTPWAQATIVLTPDGITAEAFAATDIGAQWKALADELKIGVAFLAPVDGTWNLDLQGADDGAVLSQLYFTMRSKSVKLDAPFSMDKTHTSLVGYGEGGSAALLFGAEYVTNFASITAIGAADVPAESLATIAKQTVLPFPANDALFSEEMNVLAETVGCPVWFLNTEAPNAEAYFAATAAACKNGAIEIKKPTRPSAKSYRVLSVAVDEYNGDELYIARYLPRAKVTGFSEQSFGGGDEPIMWGVTFTGEEDSALGFSESWLFGGPGWKALLEKMGFPAVSG